MNADYTTMYTLSVNMPLEQPRSGGFAGPLALNTRQKLEELIDERGVGECYGGGSGMGAMDVSLGVQDVDLGSAQVEVLLRELGVYHYTITHINDDGDLVRVVKD